MRKKLKKIISAFLVFLLLAAAVLIYLLNSGSGDKKAGTLTLTVLDVGQGDAILLSCDAGCCLVDTGPRSALDTVCAALDCSGADRLSLFFLTHTDSDHAANAAQIIERYRPVCLYVPDLSVSDSCMTAIKKAAFSCGCELREARSGNVYYFGSAELEILSPGQTLSGDENSDSLVIAVKHGEGRALLMGDADTGTEERLLSAFSPAYLKADIIKAGHHGADTSTSAEFLQTVSPAYALISCGSANSFGHPHAAVLKRLKDAGVAVLRTDISGNIVFVSDGSAFVPG